MFISKGNKVNSFENIFVTKMLSNKSIIKALLLKSKQEKKDNKCFINLFEKNV